MSSLPAPTRWSQEQPSSSWPAQPTPKAITLPPSPASAGERHGAGASKQPNRHAAASRLWLEAAGARLERALEDGRAGLRTSWFYRVTLRGPVAKQLKFEPTDLRSFSLEDAEALFHNRFRLAGQVVDAKSGGIFDHDPPTPAFAAALHGFEWLRHLEAAGSEDARRLAQQLVGAWLDRNGLYGKPAWQPEIIAGRFLNLFSHAQFVIGGSDPSWRAKLFQSLRDQALVLARTVTGAPLGLPRLQAAAALSLAGVCLADKRHAPRGFAALKQQLEEQILPDGGHVSRSPEVQLEVLRTLLLVQQVVDAAGREGFPPLSDALARMAPALRFFRLGDGTLAVFNGGSETDARLVTAILEKDAARVRPTPALPHSGYHRLAAGRSTIVMDAGAPPPPAHATAAHAGFLAFEMTAGGQRLIVNCGAALAHDERWQDALRATAAHSTLTVGDTSAAGVLAQPRLREALGARLLAKGTVETRRLETADGDILEGSHDFYAAAFGVVHQRRLKLTKRGSQLSGTDRLIVTQKATRRRPLPFAIRFHIHPDIRLSLAQGGGSVILKLPNGEGWRFRMGGGLLSVEQSVYLGGGVLRRAEQLVLAGHIRDEDVECAWLLEQVGAS